MLTRFRPVLLLFFFSVVAAGCTGEPPPSGLFSFTAILGGRHTVAAGDRVMGNVYMLAGELVVEPGASVAGSMLVLGGDVRVSGAVSGEITLVGGGWKSDRLRGWPALSRSPAGNSSYRLRPSCRAASMRKKSRRSSAPAHRPEWAGPCSRAWLLRWRSPYWAMCWRVTSPARWHASPTQSPATLLLRLRWAC